MTIDADRFVCRDTPSHQRTPFKFAFFLQINKNDFVNFDYIFGMDDHNIEDLNERAPKNATAKILLLGEFDPNGERIIRDPYYVS